MIYKRCSRCGKRLEVGQTCECVKQRHKEYDRCSRDKDAAKFYSSASWKRMRQYILDKRLFEVQAFPKTQWKDPSTEIQTRGESTQFTTPSTEGTALPNDDGVYKFEECFDTETEALAYLAKKFPKHSA